MYYHHGCRGKFIIGRIWYFEFCRSCARHLDTVRSKLYDELRQAEDDWDEELWIHSMVRHFRKGRGLARPPYKYMHRLQKHIYVLLRSGVRLERLEEHECEVPPEGRQRNPQRSTTPPPRRPPPMEIPPTSLLPYAGRRHPYRMSPAETGERQPGMSSNSRQVPAVDDRL